MLTSRVSADDCCARLPLGQPPTIPGADSTCGSCKRTTMLSVSTNTSAEQMLVPKFGGMLSADRLTCFGTRGQTRVPSKRERRMLKHGNLRASGHDESSCASLLATE